MTEEARTRPPQHQDHQPGREHEMVPPPRSARRDYRGSGKLEGQAALITGGDSGIGRAVARLFAREGCDVAIGYLEEERDAEETKRLVEEEGRRCLLLPGDVADEGYCEEAVAAVVSAFGRLDVLVNNAAEQWVETDLEKISSTEFERTLRVNFFSHFYMTKAALPHMKEGASIIGTTSIVAYKGHARLIPYACSKGAIVAFIRSLAPVLAERGIRINGVAPGPVWTPLVPASFSEEHVERFGLNTPMRRPGEPEEIAPAYVFLASEDASYISGQVIHPNGGVVVNG